MGRLRVLVAEDHHLVAEGTRLLIEREPDMEVVAQARDGLQAVQLASSLQPDVALLDVRMPALNGVLAAARIVELCPGTRVLILSAYDDEEYVVEALEAGAHGYLLKTASPQELVEAVRAVARGEFVLPPELAYRMARRWAIRHASPDERSAGEPPLTSRELQVLRLVARGLRNKEIAAQLGVSVRTVEAHIHSILNKLGASSRTEAVVHGVARGWFTAEPESEPAAAIR